MGIEEQGIHIERWEENGVTCSTDKRLLDVDSTHNFLTNDAYWAKGRTKDQVKRSIQHSLCFGLYEAGNQLGFARVVTDFTIYAYLMDVFVLPEGRGKGLGKFLLRCIMAHPELQGVKRWMLGTEDAHGLYARHGFTPLEKVENHMERVV